MFLFHRRKKLDHKQKIVIGFVLSVMSILASVLFLIAVALPTSSWFVSQGLLHLDMFLVTFISVFFMAVQGMILFGFPIYYAQDKKCHMTGLQILVYNLMWQVILVALVIVLALLMG